MRLSYAASSEPDILRMCFVVSSLASLATISFTGVITFNVYKMDKCRASSPTAALINNSQRCYGIFVELILRLFELLIDQVVEDYLDRCFCTAFTGHS
jgi:hypothetical protein